MRKERIDQICLFVAATARIAHDDDWDLRELGPIHFLKYLYLADLAYAEKHGTSFTEIEWTFHDFGPWSVQARERIPAALEVPGILFKDIDGKYDSNFYRWDIGSLNRAEEIQREASSDLPMEIRLALKRHVKEYGNDTSGLLHHVYQTEPMLRAAPEGALSFDNLGRQGSDTATAEPQPVRPKVAKKRRELLRDGKARFAAKAAERLEQRAALKAAQPAPRYDEVFEKGTEALDALAGEVLTEGTLEFGDSIWDSPARRGLQDDDD
jgi:hypothetical protein